MSISIEVPVDKIPYIRTIEGRKFKDGKWEFPNSAADILKQYGLVDGGYSVSKNPFCEYPMSDYLREYQKDITNKALNYGCYGIFADTGTGKTAIGLEISLHYDKTLILCPLSVIETAWIDDCHRFYDGVKIVNCWGNGRKERIDKLNSTADIYVMNYDTFKILKNAILDAKFDCMIIDESSVMKNMRSQITSDILDVGKTIPHRFVLSGTPTPNRNDEIFPQMKFVDPDVLGNNFYGFLARYFTQDMADPHRWFQTEENKEAYYNRLREKSVFIRKEDCVDLPEKVFEIRRFELAKEQRKTYDNMIRDIQDNINKWSKFEFTAKLMKLREITSGFVINKDGSITNFPTNKDKVLSEAIDEIGDNQVIIWCQFIHEVEKVADLCGGVALTSKTKNRDDIIRDFKSGKIRRLVSHPKILGHGVTFVNCTYNIYYSLSFSYEEFKQSQDRIHRIGQESKCTYLILQGKDTIDEKIYDCLNRKGNAVDELYIEMGLKV